MNWVTVDCSRTTREVKHDKTGQSNATEGVYFYRLMCNYGKRESQDKALATIAVVCYI